MESFKKYSGSHIYCDMDGVLVDFDGGVKETLPGVYREEVSPYKYNIGVQGWKTIDSVPNWWYNLKPKNDFRTLWSFIEAFNPYILSAVPHTSGGSSNPDSIVRQKTQWCKKWLGIPESRVIVTERRLKKLYAKVSGVPNILIDDTKMNLDEWKQSGGKGVLFTSASKAVSELKSII